MLIEFKTSASDSLFHPSPVAYLLGFDLEVHVSFILSPAKINDIFHIVNFNS